MEVNNRFQLLDSLPTQANLIHSYSIDSNASEQQQQEIIDENPTKNYWEIPEYVEKSIPCVSPINTKEKTTKSTKKEKKSSHIKHVKPIVNIQTDEEQQNEVEYVPIVEVQSQPTPHSYYPPQPYKFKQTSTNHRNESIPKFNRKQNIIPKYTATRGNSKSCTHQI